MPSSLIVRARGETLKIGMSLSVTATLTAAGVMAA